MCAIRLCAWILSAPSSPKEKRILTKFKLFDVCVKELFCERIYGILTLGYFLFDL